MAKMSTERFHQLRRQWRSVGITEASIWEHYKGGVYVVDGFGIDTHHGGFLVRYHRVDGPGYESRDEDGIQFFRAPEEWLEPVKGPVLRFRKITD